KLDVVSSQRQSFPNLSGHHVVQKNDVDAVDLDESARLLQIISLYFDADVRPFLAKLANLVGKPGKSSKGRQVIVLYEYHVVQPRTVINAATSYNRGFFQNAQSRSCFASIQYFGRMIANCVNELASQRCDAAEALKKIERHAFGLKNRTR